jgi:hypothetical protein
MAAIPISIQGAAIIVGMMRLGALAVQTIAQTTPTSSQARTATLAFQKAWNLAQPTMRAGGMQDAETPRLTEDGLYGRNTAAALTTAITNGTAPLPQDGGSVARWWQTNQAGVSQYIDGVRAEAQAQVVASTNDAAAAAHIASGADQVMQTAQQAATQVVSDASHQASSSTSLPGQGGHTGPTMITGDEILVTGQAPQKSNLLWIVIGALGVLGFGGVIAWAAYRKRKRARRG